MELSSGCIQAIFNKQEPRPAIVQVLAVKQVHNGNRFKVNVSDGRFSCNVMLATQQNELVHEGKLANGSIVDMLQTVCNEVNNRSIVILLGLQVVGKVDGIIGNPVPIEVNGKPNVGNVVPQQQMNSGNAPTMRPSAPANPAPVHMSYNAQPTNSYAAQQRPVNAQPAQRNNMYGNAMQPINSMKREPIVTVQDPNIASGCVPVSMLSLYTQKWKIKARVINKTDIRRWDKGPKNQGMLFSITLMDKEGTEIRATFFREAVERFFETIQENKVYYFSKGKVKVSNPQFTRIRNDIELVFDQNSEIIEDQQDNEIQAVKLQRVLIGDIENLAPDSFCDVVGIVTEVSEIKEFTSKAGKPLKKIDVLLIDESNTSIRVTLWNDRAVNFSSSCSIPNQVVTFKGATVSEYGGRTLGTGSSTQVLINPNIPEAFNVKQWFANGGQSGQTKSLSSSSGGGKTARGFQDRHTLICIRDLGLGKNSEKPDWIQVKATITKIFSEGKLWYEACPTEGSNAKVTPNGDGTYNCASTGAIYTSKRNRYILRCSVADFTGSFIVTLFDDQARTILGKSADELETIQSESEDAYKAVIDNVQFKSFIFTLRCKEEDYQGRTSVKGFVQTMTPIDYANESLDMIKVLESYA